MKVRQSDLQCRFPGCAKPRLARGLCGAHYGQLQSGKPEAIAAAQPLIRRTAGLTHVQAFELVDKRISATGCIEWLGHTSRYGYGIIQSKLYGSVGAHRVALALALGEPIPTDKHVLHRCDNPPCVNPDHLFVGTDQDNVNDMVTKKRHYHGECVRTRKLSEAQVREIRERYAAGGVGRPELAREYGVSASAIQGLTERRTWKHVP